MEDANSSQPPKKSKLIKNFSPNAYKPKKSPYNFLHIKEKGYLHPSYTNDFIQITDTNFPDIQKSLDNILGEKKNLKDLINRLAKLQKAIFSIQIINGDFYMQIKNAEQNNLLLIKIMHSFNINGITRRISSSLALLSFLQIDGSLIVKL